MIVDGPWAADVLYFQYTPLTVEYDLELDAFTVARADIHPPGRRHRLRLSILVTDREIAVEHIPLEAAIARGRGVLERLVEAHRGSAAELTADQTRAFDLSGRRIR
jgi:hypothetical protein